MRVNCFTSFSFSYLPRARVLGWSLKRYHPDWAVTACISDREPEGFVFNIEKEPFDHVIWTDELRIDDIRGWFFKHDVVEICTAVKGPVLDLLTGTNADRILYLDPDIAVMESLQPIVEMLDEHSVLLTPHLVEAETDHGAVLDNEIAPLRHGTYNLGFIAVRNDEKGRKFARWWKSRLMHFCYDDAAQGLFVDQKWCDLVPVFFDGVHIVRDPGYNVASWNINQRKVQVDREGRILANDRPLRFFHFTKVGGAGDTMIQRYAKDNLAVYELCSWYKRMVDRYAEADIPEGWWHYGTFDNKVAIPKHVRQLYRERRDLQKAFPDPYEVKDRSYYSWLKSDGYM